MNLCMTSRVWGDRLRPTHGDIGMSRLRRRQLLLGVGASAAGLVVLAGCGSVPKLAPRTLPLIGFLSNLDAGGQVDQIDGFRDGLREHGLVEGENLRVEWRFADGDNDLLPGLIAELLGLGVQVIVATGGTVPRYIRQATDRVPVVQLGGGPVTSGLAASQNRPGGNVTGVAFPDELATKALETLVEVVPGGRRLAFVANLSGVSSAPQQMIESAERLQLEILPLDIRAQADLEPAFERAATWRADMLTPHNVAPLNVPRELIPTLALRWRLPAASQNLAWTEADLLLSYNGSLRHVGYRCADYVARILNGANPAEMPVEITTVFDLAVNRGTLAHLGLTLPPQVAAQVTRWIG